MIERRYRQDYPGEFVILNTDIHLGIKKQHKEWIENTIKFQPCTPCAAVIGHDGDREQFDFARLQKHRGGLQGRKKLRTYGTGNIWQQMHLDVYCGTDRSKLNALQESGYQERTLVYTTARFCMMFPGQFYMIPFQPPINELAAAVYLAAFDGYQQIYLLGYSLDTPGNTVRWQEDVAEVIKTYNTHQFVLVGGPSNMPDLWRNLENVDCLTYRQFRTTVDI